MTAEVCRCGHTAASHRPLACPGCAGPACVEDPAVRLVVAAVLDAPVNSLTDDVEAALRFIAGVIHEDSTDGAHVRAALGLRLEGRRPTVHRTVGHWVYAL